MKIGGQRNNLYTNNNCACTENDEVEIYREIMKMIIHEKTVDIEQTVKCK